jgi:hypothetical protein
LSIRIKISFVPVALAWLIIFIHGAIPHNHQQEHNDGCSSVYHCCHDSDHTELPNEEGEEEWSGTDAGHDPHFICHFSTGLFHSLDNNSPFIAGSQLRFRSATVEETEILAVYSGPALNSRQESPENLRGPPQLMG